MIALETARGRGRRRRGRKSFDSSVSFLMLSALSLSAEVGCIHTSAGVIPWSGPCHLIHDHTAPK
jgi:hypothetical protein